MADDSVINIHSKILDFFSAFVEAEE